MEEALEDLMEQEEYDGSDKPQSSLKAPFRSTRMHIQRSSVCSRAYFVVVMVFFHVYILNVIGLLLYVHYNNGPGDLVSEDGAPSASLSDSGTPLPHPDPASRELHVGEYSQSFSLPRIEGIRVGHVQQVSLLPDRTHVLRTMSLKPLLFEIPGFLSEEECRVVVQLAQLKGLMESQTTAPSQGQVESNQPLLSLSTEEVFSLLDLNQDGLLQNKEIVSHSRSQDGTWLNPDNLRQILTGLEACPTGILTLEDFRRVYDVSQRPGQQQSRNLRSRFKQRNKHTWLYQGPGSHHVLQTLRNRLISLTRLPSTLVELSEPLQVIRYENGDFSNAHHDSSSSQSETTCTHTRLAGNKSALTEVSCRYLTMLFYLSAVQEGGESTFPVADNRTYEEQALVQDGVDLTDTQETCARGNIRIKPTAGTALLWYNHLSDGRGWMGELDEYSLHGDCPVRRGVKWMANSWVNVDPDHQQQARYQRLVAQRHRSKSGMEEHYQPLSHSDLHQDL
ncbi:LOW QUALITY PROTEIN: transmembrane prolyl 4-hydroxylase-like [Cottoperca gobio]|uniref:LOW QUALITY PROTEIN: transmembrane prolyl 4-hydroxylase-like n=1 Tax=Cottoperca gobio TaxID=56716 RepID=A0A6J2Q201_COTGO|nr:LOW QUALITY PROTEIN: transmembrane prolyl 4-hydroxylase-like [Cottoperca gobio]